VIRLRRASGPPDADVARRLRTTAALERGELPPDLVGRHRRAGPFTSALSTADLAALRSIGGMPLGLVSGACVIGSLDQPLPSPRPVTVGRSGLVRELAVRSNAHNEARATAVRRLEEEAALLDADAVVGVRLRRDEKPATPDERGIVQVVATGTAVRLPERAARGATTIGAGELASLARRGWQTVTLVAATSVCYVAAGPDSVDRFGLRWAEGGQNPEAYGYTRGLYAARSRVVGRLEAQGRKAGADGIVGVVYEQHVAGVKREGYGVRDLEVTLHVVGTGVAAARLQPGATAAAVVLA
jgi:uncharacterized protein YbjQ (UPF0145 family)